MKIALFSLPVALFALLGFSPSAAFGQDPADSLPATVTQLFADLGTIASGGTATDAQHQALVADLDALAAGVFTPDAAAVDQLATDLAAAAASGFLSADVLASLVDDFAGDSVDPTTDPDGWMDDIQDDVASLLGPSTTVTGDPGAGTVVTTVTPVYTMGGVLVGSTGQSCDRTSFGLAAQGIPPFLLENYAGRVQLTARSVGGIVSQSALHLDTNGLPIINPYTVSITRQSDGTRVVLGKLRVHSGIEHPLPSTAPAGRETASFTPEAELLSYGRASFSGRDTADVATVSVTDAHGVVRLSGSVQNSGEMMKQVTTLRLPLNSPAIVPGSAPRGSVAARHTVIGTVASNHFRLAARHLPGTTSLTLLTDGKTVGEFTTTARGRLLLAEGFTPRSRSGQAPAFYPLPAGTNLVGVKSFSLRDPQGQVLLTGNVMP